MKIRQPKLTMMIKITKTLQKKMNTLTIATQDFTLDDLS